MIGCWVVRLWPVACLPGELSQHPTWPHSWHHRRCTQSCLPAATHSTQPGPDGPTSFIWPMCLHDLPIGRDSEARRPARARVSIYMERSICSVLYGAVYME